MVFIPIAAAASFLPFTVSGLGVRETAFVALFASVGVGEGVALAGSLSIYCTQVVLAAFGGLATFGGDRHDRFAAGSATRD
jgi:hypothetical protein